MCNTCTFRKDSITQTTNLSCLDECRSSRRNWEGESSAAEENEDWNRRRRGTVPLQASGPTGKLLVGRVGQVYEDDGNGKNESGGLTSRVQPIGPVIGPVVQFSEAQKQRVQELARERALSKIYALFDEGQITEEDLHKKVEGINSGKLNQTSTSCSPSRRRDNCAESRTRAASPARTSESRRESVKYYIPGRELDPYRPKASKHVRPGFGEVQVRIAIMRSV